MNDAQDAPAKVRTRFPPSPTGALHLGGARTALFNWLYARHHGGEFVLRLEDTDQERSKRAHVESILQAMEWLGLDYDEGPYYQSQRFDRYQEAINQMLAVGKAYWCHCSTQELQVQRELAMAQGKKARYDGSCRHKGLGPAPGAVVRFKGPLSGETTFHDLVKGNISFSHQELDDLVILRSGGAPTYHMAVVVDDIDMGITHVIRGDDHVNNTPRQILLYQALGARLPAFAHVPMILGPDRAKLSKRHGATSVVEYKALGYLPEAMINALVRVGWSHGDQEIFSRQELVKLFGLDGAGKSAAVFDQDKLLNLNHHYIQKSRPEHLAGLLAPFLAQRGIETGQAEQATLLAALPYLTARTKTLAELAEWAEPYLVDVPVMDPKAKKKFLKPAAAPILERVRSIISEMGAEKPTVLEEAFRELAAEFEVGLGKVAQPTRVALVGRTNSPGIFEVMGILGKDQVLARLDRALGLIET